jgi:hypothetical protein
MVMNKRRSFVTGLLGLAGLSSVKRAAADEGGGRGNLLFKYRNVVTKFSPTAPPSATITFAGADLGTVEGVLSGTIIQNFSVTVNTSTGAATTGPDNSLFTDLDLDQISFEFQGTGNFLPPIPNLNGLMSAGGSLAVTYRVLNASGKYRFLIGRQFTAKVVATNALPGAVSGGVLGSVYAEVYAPDVEAIERALNR